jgi:hypothetical protein
LLVNEYVRVGQTAGAGLFYAREVTVIPVSEEIRPRPGDGRICAGDAAKLANVSRAAISQWIAKGYLTDVRREGRFVWLVPKEVIETEWRVHAAERARMERVLGVALDWDRDEAMA